MVKPTYGDARADAKPETGGAAEMLAGATVASFAVPAGPVVAGAAIVVLAAVTIWRMRTEPPREAPMSAPPPSAKFPPPQAPSGPPPKVIALQYESLAEIKAREEATRRKQEEERQNALHTELQKKQEDAKKRQEEEERGRQQEPELLAAQNATRNMEIEEVEKIKFHDNAIGNAVQELRKEANQWDETSNAVVSYAKLIAQKFNRMADIHDKPNAMRELVELAEEIVQTAQAEAKVARKYADNCADEWLKNELEQTVKTMGTFSTQLLMIGNVKTSNNMNNESDRCEQLTVCAKNLMTSVQRCVGQCHAASLKPINKNDQRLATVMWRRIV